MGNRWRIPDRIPSWVYVAFLREKEIRPNVTIEEVAEDLLRSPTGVAGSKREIRDDRKGTITGSIMGAREEKRVGGRHPRVLVKRPDLGITFDSRLEERRYDFLSRQDTVTHIDLQPIFTLTGGVRYKADFLVWSSDKHLPHVEDVKGWLSTPYRRIVQLFRAHPLTLYTVTWDKKDGLWAMSPNIPLDGAKTKKFVTTQVIKQKDQ